MPRGKYIRKKKRDESALITRLMQISLKMDDHIYYGKHITASEAGGFLQEIATLKLQCAPTNVRALQVIEKLTRCMRSITEDSVDCGPSFNTSLINTQYTGSTSPVYSLPDEDKVDGNDVDILDSPDNDEIYRNQIQSPAPGQINVTHETEKQETISMSPKAQNNSHALNNLNDVEVIDITVDSETDEGKNVVVSTVQNSITRINAGISNMTIEEGGPSQTADDNCSQSILDNCDNDKPNTIVVDKEKDIIVEKETHKVDPKAQVMNKVHNYLNTHTPLIHATAMSIQTSNIETSNLINSVPTSVNTELVNQAQHALTEKKIKRRKKKTEIGQNDKIKKNSKSRANNALQNCYHQDTITYMVTKQKQITKETNKENSVKAIRKPKKNPKKSHVIYNNNVENDLSWVENLRYVREISSEEHDPALSLLQDNFWDNFALPNSWDDTEFG